MRVLVGGVQIFLTPESFALLPLMLLLLFTLLSVGCTTLVPQPKYFKMIASKMTRDTPPAPAALWINGCGDDGGDDGGGGTTVIMKIEQ